MIRMWRWGIVALCCLVALTACDAATPSLAPLVVPSPLASTEASAASATELPSAATSTPAPPITPITKAPDGKYLFLEIWYNADGSGNLPRMTIDFPTYAFDAAKGTLSATQYSRGRPVALHAGDWGMLGTGSHRAGSAGSGTGNGLERLAALPFSTNVTLATGQATDSGEATRKAVVKLQGVSSDGRVEAVIDGERVVLAPGVKWQRRLTATLATVNHNGQYDLTSSVTNYGWLEQSAIQNTP